MVHIPGIPAALVRPIGELTLEGGSVQPGTPVIVLHGGIPGDNEWVFIPANEEKTKYAIRNLKSNTFLSFTGEPHPDKDLVGEPHPRDWIVEPVEDRPGHLVAFLRLAEKPHLVVDVAGPRAPPPRRLFAALQEKKEGLEQAWIFHFHE